MSSIPVNRCTLCFPMKLKHHIPNKSHIYGSKVYFSSKITDYSQYFSENALKRKPSPIRELNPIARQPGMISLAAGLPNNNLFPMKSFSFHVPSKQSIMNNTSSTEDLHEISFTDTELDIALQYSPTPGIPQFIEQLKELHASQHTMQFNKESDWDLLISTGSQDLIVRTIDTLLNENENETIIIEAPSYSGILAYINAKNINVLSIDVDEYGIIPHLLKNALESYKKYGSPMPKLLYMIPVGQNPAGMTYSLERKQEIYQIACEYNLLIFEDDPYFHLHFGSKEKAAENIAQAFSDSTKIVSFQSLDVEGRVIRSDSFSKILSSGMRVGYITGASDILNRIQLNMQATHLHSSGLSQMVIYKLVDYYGLDAFVNHHLKNVAFYYWRQRDLMEKYLQIHLAQKCRWNIPISGMFYWLELLSNETADTGKLIQEKAIAAGVLLLPGKVFYEPNDIRSQECKYVRASFSIATEEQINEGLKRFANLLE